MAPKKPAAGEQVKKSNKFRLVVFEGDFSDSSVSQIAQALTSALRPTAPSVIRQLHNGKPAGQFLPPDPDEDLQTEEEDEVADSVEEQPAEEAGPIAPKIPRVKKPPKPPEYLPDLITDINAFKEFANQKNPTSKNQQYLVATFWLKKYGNTATVTADMIYTCYKTAPWPAGFNDWNQPFHNLVRDELMRRVGKGEFAINPTGEHQVEHGNA